MQHIYTNISNKIKDLATESNSDVMIYYADLESFPLSSEAEMNKTDREFFEYLRKNYSSEKNKKLILLIHLGGGLLKAATDLIRFLRIEYQNSITTIVCKEADSSASYLALSGNTLFLNDSPSAIMSDFLPITGHELKDYNLAKRLTEQFFDTVMNDIGAGLLACYPPNEVFTIVNRISPMYVTRTTKHEEYDYEYMENSLDGCLKPLSNHPNKTQILNLHEELLNEISKEEVKKVIILGDFHEIY